MKNYDKLKEEIVRVNPEIMELKFGCRAWITAKETLFDKIGKRQLSYQLSVKIISCEMDPVALKYYIRGLHSDGVGKYHVDYKDVKSLGRPITLQDVLYTIERKLQFKTKAKGKMIISEKDSISWINVIPLWIDEGDDNLDHKSDACKEFLINLILK